MPIPSAGDGADGSGHIIFESPGMQGYADYGHAETYQEVRLDGEKYILFVNDIPETGWKSLCFVPERKMEINDPSILKATLLVLILAVFLCLLMSWLLCLWLLGPLEGLRSHIRRVEEGDFSIEVTSEAEDEIGQLTNAFGAMIKKLNILVNEVYRSQIIQKEAEFKMLQAQLNPHFLYNTLSFINWSAIRAGEMEIAKISRDISAFYRTALNTLCIFAVQAALSLCHRFFFIIAKTYFFEITCAFFCILLSDRDFFHHISHYSSPPH